MSILDDHTEILKKGEYKTFDILKSKINAIYSDADIEATKYINQMYQICPNRMDELPHSYIGLRNENSKFAHAEIGYNEEIGRLRLENESLKIAKDRLLYELSKHMGEDEIEALLGESPETHGVHNPINIVHTFMDSDMCF